MTEVNETRLPGVGIRHDLTLRSGDRLGVVSHRSGRADLVVYDPDDGDGCSPIARLSAEEGGILAEILGSLYFTARFERARQEVEGLSIDWLSVDRASRFAATSIAEQRIRTRTGVSVVAVLRDGTAIPAPGPEVMMRAGDTLCTCGGNRCACSGDMKPRW